MIVTPLGLVILERQTPTPTPRPSRKDPDRTPEELITVIRAEGLIGKNRPLLEPTNLITVIR